MFAEKAFYLVNREERHFGFLLISSIIYDKDFREYFFNLINERLYDEPFVSMDVGIPKIVNPDDFDIYSEVALFRDYWNDLGDPNSYTKELHNNRKNIIEIFLENFGVNKTVIENYSMFWTGKIGESKLWFPGKWPIELINLLQKEEKITDRGLLRIRWACNAKPDLLIISKNYGLFIELKLESGIGTNDSGYNQEETQYDIMDLAKLTIPNFNNLDFKRIILDKQSGIVNWDDIKSKFTNELVKKHMLNLPK